MYKLKKEFFDQEVVVCTPSNRYIKLDGATQEEFEIAIKIKGNEKFIDEEKGKAKKSAKKEVEKEVEVKKVVKKTIK